MNKVAQTWHRISHTVSCQEEACQHAVFTDMKRAVPGSTKWIAVFRKEKQETRWKQRAALRVDKEVPGYPCTNKATKGVHRGEEWRSLYYVNPHWLAEYLHSRIRYYFNYLFNYYFINLKPNNNNKKEAIWQFTLLQGLCLGSHLSWAFYCWYKNTTTKTTLGRKGFGFHLQCSDHKHHEGDLGQEFQTRT